MNIKNGLPSRGTRNLIGEKLNKVNKAVGYLMGRLSVIGFNDKMSAVVESISHDIIASSELKEWN